MKKKLICIFMAILLLLCAVGCNNEGGENKEITAETTTGNTTATTKPKQEEKFMSETLFKNGETDFRIVYNGTDKAIADMVNEFSDYLLDEHDVDIYYTDVTKDSSSYAKELIIGDARDIAKPVVESLANTNDFAIKVLENAIVFCATNEMSYKYLFDFVKNEYIEKVGVEDLTLNSNNNMVYSSSSMKETSYIDYLMYVNNESKCTAALINTVFEYRENTHEGTTLPYRLYVPFDYTPDKDYPVLLFMHGAGERGNDGDKHLANFPVMTNLFNLENAPVKDAIIIAPQCPTNEKWVDMNWSSESYSVDNTPESNEMKCVLDILDKTFDEFSVDLDRVYVTGVSMGGIGTWDLLARHNDIFAAAVPMCGVGDATKADILKNTPIWTVHSKDDPTVPFAGSKNVVDAINAAGGEKIQFSELNGYGHNIWGWTSSNDEIYSWLFEQSK